MIDTLICVMVVVLDTAAITNNKFDKLFDEADRQFNIVMMRQASHEAAAKAAREVGKAYKILKIYRKKDEK